MEIKINIDESKFQEVLEKELGAFTQEELHSIMKDAIREYLNKEDVLKELINHREVDRWGSPVGGTSTLDKFVNNVDLTDVFAEPKQKIKEIISSDENLKMAAMELLAGIFRDRFRNAFINDYQFIDMISNEVAAKLSQRNQGM